MAKAITDAIIDGGLDKMATCTRLTVLSAQPASITEIATTYKLCSVVIDSGDFTKANGDTSGRKCTVGAQTAIIITTSGTATHIAIDDGTDWVVTTCTNQALTANGTNTVTVPAWKLEIADPT